MMIRIENELFKTADEVEVAGEIETVITPIVEKLGERYAASVKNGGENNEEICKKAREIYDNLGNSRRKGTFDGFIETIPERFFFSDMKITADGKEYLAKGTRCTTGIGSIPVVVIKEVEA